MVPQAPGGQVIRQLGPPEMQGSGLMIPVKAVRDPRPGPPVMNVTCSLRTLSGNFTERRLMQLNMPSKLRLTTIVALCAVVTTGVASAQTMKKAEKQSEAAAAAAPEEKATLNGAVIKREGDKFLMRLLDRSEHQVILTDKTTIKSERKGAFRGAHPYDVTSIIDGLIVEVDGTYDKMGNVVANRIRFTEADLHSAITAQIHAKPIADSADAAHQRITDLDQWEEKGVVSVYFATNSSEINAEGKKALDDLAAKAPGASNYKVEIMGHTDATGVSPLNDELSEKRAEAVVKYLTVDKSIALRRVTLPMGYGATAGTFDNSTEEGRAKNRRVDVHVLINKGASAETPKIR